MNRLLQMKEALEIQIKRITSGNQTSADAKTNLEELQKMLKEICDQIELIKLYPEEK